MSGAAAASSQQHSACQQHSRRLAPPSSRPARGSSLPAQGRCATPPSPMRLCGYNKAHNGNSSTTGTRAREQHKPHHAPAQRAAGERGSPRGKRRASKTTGKAGKQRSSHKASGERGRREREVGVTQHAEEHSRGEGEDGGSKGREERGKGGGGKEARNQARQQMRYRCEDVKLRRGEDGDTELRRARRCQRRGPGRGG